MEDIFFSQPVSRLLGTSHPITSSPKDSLHKILTTMQTSKVGAVMITENTAVVGMFTERDFIMKIADTGLDFEKECVGDYMSKKPTSMPPTAEILEAVKLMFFNGFRHIVIDYAGVQMSDIVSIRDVVGSMPETYEELSTSVQQLVATALPIAYPPDTTIHHILQAMKSINIGSICVTEDDYAKGIFTERDYIIKIAGASYDAGNDPVSKHMTPNPVCVPKEETIRNALRLMRVGKIRHMVIADPGSRIDSVISIKDILNFVATRICKLEAAS